LLRSGSGTDVGCNSKRVMLKKLNLRTMEFIKNRPYMSRLHCYTSVCPVLKLVQVDLNEKMTN
jgi:hypothetical protein